MPSNPFIGKISQYVIRNPFTVAASALTAAAVPLFAKSEDRGYLRTALLTTPIIFASSVVLPDAFSGIRDLGRGIFKSKTPVQALFNAAIPQNRIEQQIALAESLIRKPTRNIAAELSALEKRVGRFLITPSLVAGAQSGDKDFIRVVAEIEALQKTKGELISGSFYAARHAAMTPRERALLAQTAVGDFDAIEGLPTLNNEQMLEMYEQYKNIRGTATPDPIFIRTLNQRLKEINKLSYKGTLDTFMGSSVAPNTKTFKLDFDTKFGLGLGEEEFRTQFPTTWENLRLAKEQRLILDPVVTVMKDSNAKGEIGRILRTDVTRRGGVKDVVKIPMVDKVTGEARLGDLFEQAAVGTNVIGIDKAGNVGEEYTLNDWISMLLSEHSDIPTEGPTGLQAEIEAHSHWKAGDPQDSHRMTELESFGEGGESIYNPESIRLRSQSASMPKVPIFTNTAGEKVPFGDLSYEEQMPIRKQVARADNLILMGSESGGHELRYQQRKAAILDPLAAPGATKQNPWWRIFTKETQLSAPQGLSPEARLRWKNAAWGEDSPLARGIVHMIDPEDRTLFSELPATLDELITKKVHVTAQFASRMSAEDAGAMFQDIQKVYEAGGQEVLVQFGKMGESVTVMDASLANQLRARHVSQYRVNKLGVKVGDVVGPEDILGFNGPGDARVLPKHYGRVISTGKGPEGFIVNIAHELGMKGAKTDVGGVKGMNLTSIHEEFQLQRAILNSYYSRTKSGKFIPADVNIFGASEFLGQKVEPTQAYLGLSSDLVQRLESVGAGNVSEDYLARMRSEFHGDWQDGQLVVDASKYSDLSDKAMAARHTRFSAANEEFYAKAEEAVRASGGWNDPVLQAFAKQSKSYANWMQESRVELPFGVWDHSLKDVPSMMKIGYDFESYMAQAHLPKTLVAIRSRLQTISGGDPQQAIDFMKTLMSGDTTGMETVPLSEAFSGGGPLKSSMGRDRSIFDPSIERFKKNFRIDMGEGRFLPVPGTAAYGAEAPLYGAKGEYQTHDWQHTWQDIANAKTAEERAALETELLQQYKSEFGIGKGSAIRPYEYDPFAVSGVIAAKPDLGEPFVAHVGEEIVASMHTARQREAMKAGDMVLGVMQRQPTNILTGMAYKYDATENATRNVAMSQITSVMRYGDHDRDTVTNSLLDVHVRMEDGKMKLVSWGTEADKAAAEELIAAMGPGGTQWQDIEAWKQIKGTADVPQYTPADWRRKTILERENTIAENIANRSKVAISRSAGAATGPYSNILTEATEQMIRNSSVMNDYATLTSLRTGLFEIRQAPISGIKTPNFGLEQHSAIVSSLHKGLAMTNPDEAAAHWQGLLMNMSKTFKGEESLEFKYWADPERGGLHLKKLMAGRTEEARISAAALKVGVGKKGRIRAAEEVLPELFGKGYEEIMGPIHGGRSAATESASKLGAIADFLGEAGRKAGKSATGRVAEIFSKHGKAMAVGVGALAALGIALTPRRSPVAAFSRTSGNKYRPEERMNVSGNIPGEPMAGQMSSNPPRRAIPAQPGVRTAVVAPMNRTSDLSVTMRATDHSRAAETAKLLSQIPGNGDTNVTINYRDKTNLRSLRTREKIRGLR